MPRNVLVAVDDSPLGREALAYALDAFPDARVVAAHVAFLEFDMLPSDTPEVDAVGLDELDGVGDETAQRVFEAIREIVRERSGENRDRGSNGGRTVAVSFLTGEPGDRLVEYVEAGGFDHVVLGTHGRDGVSRLLIGSVAEDVVRRTDVPTTLVK